MHGELDERKQLWSSSNGGSVRSDEQNREENPPCAPVMLYQQMSLLTLVESFPLNSKVPQVLLLCTVCGSLNGSALDYRRKYIAATVKWGTPLLLFFKRCACSLAGLQSSR